MEWNLEEAITYYQKQGAPREQTALFGLLREIQQAHNGSIPLHTLEFVSQAYGVKESFLMAIIKRIPSLKISHQHILELCSGHNCGKHTELASFAEKLYERSNKAFALKFGPCMRMCGKGPNVKWDGTLHHKCDKILLQKLLKDAGIEF